MPTEPDALEKHIRSLHPGMTVTRGYHESLVPGFVPDLEWNSMDFWHRIFVHHTYNDALQIFSGQHFSVNVTRWGSLPLFIQVANAWLKPGLLLQTMAVLGVIYSHQTIRFTQRDRQTFIQVNWFTSSHWLLKWAHPFFNRRMLKLQRVQDAEDLEMRQDRLNLRDRGFRFGTDIPDFVNSNELSDNVFLPQKAFSVRVPLSGLVDGRVEQVDAGPVSFFVERQGTSIRVWPGLCPHEGAPFKLSHMCDRVIDCPWHGRKFKGVTFASGGTNEWVFLGATVRLLEGMILAVDFEPEAAVAAV